MASISMRAVSPPGSLPAWMHVRAGLGPSGRSWNGLVSRGTASYVVLVVCTHRDKDVVHREHVVHVFEVDVELDDLVERGARELKHLLQSGEGLGLRCISAPALPLC
jgi:phosphatidylethanolamine-binding protein (PEBP) family uncharacterized protein